MKDSLQNTDYYTLYENRHTRVKFIELLKATKNQKEKENKQKILNNP